MRVISGLARGTRLGSVPGMETRPTLDRVKEALYNIIRNHVTESDFLDLFAGNGGIGIEALSRGARSVVFVDAKSACTKMIKSNLQKTKLRGAEVYTNDVFRAIRSLSDQGRRFDVIFLDPPYGRNLAEKALLEIGSHDLLKPNGIIVAEYGIKEEINLDSSKVHQVRQEKYGDTMLGFFRCEEV